MSKRGVLAEPVIVGREKELEELQSPLNSAVEGKGTTVFISGEAGSGKTRIAREFLNNARRRGIAVMAGWCLSDAQVPFFPFIEAFNNYYAAFTEEGYHASLQQPKTQLSTEVAQVDFGVQEREITSWLTGPKPAEKLGKTEAINPQVWKDQAFAAVAKTLHLIAAHDPVVLFVEDVHWADSASLALLHYLARAIHGPERVLLLATFRSEELTADAEGHPHPLAETLRMMRREELFTEIKLPSLSQACISKMAENMIGGSLQQELAEKLSAESRGNPLFVVESLRMLHERKSLVQENSEWRLAVDELGIPSKIKDIILRRLACLKFAQRRVLDAASVIGEEFDVDLLCTVLGQDNLETLETLNQIAQSTSLVRVEENRYRFDHARSRETLYEELSAPLKRGYHNRIAEKLESMKNTSLPISDLAFHYAQAGNKEKAVKYAVASGRDELAKWSNKQAIKHFQYALQNISERQAEEKRVALEGLGDAYIASSMYAEAIKTFDELAASETGRLRLRAFRKASDAAYLKGDEPDLLLEYEKKAQELAVDDRLEMARILDNRGKAFGWAGRGDRKMDLADYDAALRVFEEENSLADVAEALWRSGVVSGMIEESREKGIGELLRSVAIFRELGNIRKEIEATINAGIGFGIMGLLSESRREHVNALRLGEKLYLFTELAQVSYYLGNSYEMGLEGVSEGLSQTLKALEYSKKTDANYMQEVIYAILIRQYSKLGDLKHADEYFDKMNKLPPESTRASHFGVVTVGQFFREIYYAAKGLWEEFNQSFKEARFEETKLKLNWPLQQIYYKTNYAWVLDKQGRIEEARVQRDEAQKMLDQVEERFGRADVELSVMLPRKVHVGEEFEMRLDLVNVGRTATTLAKIDGALPPEFDMVSLPSYCSQQNGSLEMKEKTVAPFQVETIKLKLKAAKAGSYGLDPEVSYLDDEGKMKASRTSPITVTVQPAKPAYETLPGRVITGTLELDRLLLGGIPEKYAVILAAASSDERQIQIKRFIEQGAKTGETTLYITCAAGNIENFYQQFQTNFKLVICNPQADIIIQKQPNVYTIKGVDNLTDIDIALTKLFRTLDPLLTSPKRACIDMLSDVLLQHHAVITRKWLISLLANLKSKGFTTLGVIDPGMHPAEETQAITGLFDGEIRITEKETATGLVKSLRIRKMTNQRYSENELVLTKEKLL
ncbi:MAG: BREX system ATP-binding domain-containing protein [Candidatus Bathyarchaeia archaeon]|jgi:pentatricopeptide repeat protein